MNAPITPLTSPGSLFANIPGILGFYPQSSLVLMAFATTDTATRYELGPVMRVDLNELDECASETMQVITDGGYGLVLALVVTDDRAAAENAALTLYRHDEGLIDACWTAHDLISGSTYEILFGPAGAEEAGTHWATGSIDAVHTSQTTASLLNAGEVLALDREEAFNRFAPGNPAFSPQDVATMTATARTDAQEAVNADTSDRLVAFVQDFDHFLATYDPRGACQMYADADALARGATAMASADLRDCVIGTALDHPVVAMALTKAVATTFTDPTIRSNALCVYALAATAHGISPLASTALRVSDHENPGHNLTALLAVADCNGLLPQTVAVVRRGCDSTRAEYGLSLAE